MEEDEYARPGTSQSANRGRIRTRGGEEAGSRRSGSASSEQTRPYGSGSSRRPFRGRGNRGSNPSNRRARESYTCMGFTTLERIARSDIEDILLTLNERKKGFMDIINSPIIYRSDVYVLVFEILSKVSQSPFEELKSKLILDTCNSNFINSLRHFLMDLPYSHQSQHSMYFNDQTAFWKNFLTFCTDIAAISPSTAVRTCRVLIDSISKACLDGLNQRHNFILPEEDNIKLEELRNKLSSYADGDKGEIKDNNNLTNVQDMGPPEDFRELTVVPTREDILGSQPFLRPNIVDGGYSDVEHYLDVQFRLLREDCFGPIRVGINQYLDNPSKRRYDHIRVYRDVKFVGPYISNFKIGTLVQIGTSSSKHFKHINWAHSKRFIYGSLLLFTKDRFSNIIVATVLERDNMLLQAGKLAVSIIYSTNEIKTRDEDGYTMIESEVYFEPYHHVLKALQAPTFPKHLAMQQYIVKVTPATEKPVYLADDVEFFINLKDANISNASLLEDYHEELMLRTAFKVLQCETWPSKEQLCFDESQYEAYKLALTREFAVIQGPPGTGKTYVGLSVAKTLLQNVKSNSGCLMLVICYTNHALDQFLEGISKVTKEIVRIGSQSRNKAMDEFNLVNLRKLEHFQKSRVADYFMETKEKLRSLVNDFSKELLLLDILNDGVVNYEMIEELPGINLLCKFYKKFPSIKDPLMFWLFENYLEYNTDFEECLEQYQSLVIDNDDNEYNKMRKEHKTMLDEDMDTSLEKTKNQFGKFILIDAKLKLKSLICKYSGSKLNFKEKLFTQQAIKELNCMINLFEDMMKYRSQTSGIKINDTTDFSKIAPQRRWRLYFMWINTKIVEVKQKVAELQASISPVLHAYEETRMLMDMELLKTRKTKVLGMTTSGAARMRKLLLSISPKIVIVEEAAEVLEQHIIASLTENCQHLILIGDHQQLRPSASYIKLARQYNIEISLFERMITNGIHSRQLKVQHRMRPEIAALISPNIYPDLENHPTVENFGDVAGLEKNLFFFSHEYQEEDNVNDSTSRANYKEADLTLALANYLTQQGYSCDDITILATYSGQMFYMRNERRKYSRLSDMKITVVDNYQGEESKIIILSLVRNNPENNIGFLGIENRICVALSRAKQGFYIFGNINMLKIKSPLWEKIATTLELNNSLGTVLKLKCQVHPDHITDVTSAEDFENVPEGGCLRKCNYQYSCGHHCLLYCHGYDREHIKTKCTMQCERILCDLEHVCPLKCSETCEPCKVLIVKTLPCGHDMGVFCHRSPDDPKNQCHTQIDVILPDCGHKAQKLCFEDIKAVKCTEKCKQRLVKCGHACERFCHVKFPDHDDYNCTKKCNRSKKGCTAGLIAELGPHKCEKKCNEECDDCNVQVMKKRTTCKHADKVACCQNIDDIPCIKNCARIMACGHFCKKKCSEKCGDCQIMVTKVIPDCNHEISVKCMTDVRLDGLCKKNCNRILPCGHLCMNICGAKCDQTQCKQLTTAEIESPCGHKVKLPCNVHALFNKGEIESKELLKYCQSPCGKELACGHICSGSCSKCYQNRLHVPCIQICNQQNICGHQCQEPCNQICPPCNKICEVKCEHSRCGQRCGQPCVFCKEACSRRCPHGACARVCAEPCSREPCDRACARTLPCSHRCRGLCGEPCPDVCKICRPEQFPVDFLGDEYDENAKFILLQDCGHVFEVETIDNLMRTNQENIKIRQCPKCRKSIINTNRYKDLVNDMFRNEINPIKERIYGKNTQIKEKLIELRQKASVLQTKCSEEKILKNMVLNFMRFVNSQKKMYLLLVEMLLIYCTIIEMVTDCWKEYNKAKTTTLQEEITEITTMILNVLKIKSRVTVKISEQQQKDIFKEIKRLNSIVQLAKLLSIANLTTDMKIKTDAENAKMSVLTLSVFDEEKAVESLKILETGVKSSGIVTKLERDMIVKAIGLKAGHWYKCPNGHFYCIGECGGAVHTSKCPDCGAQIGGTNHQLLQSNAHASEMDGSQFPAYSEAANDMANFLLNDIN